MNPHSFAAPHWVPSLPKVLLPIPTDYVEMAMGNPTLDVTKL